MNLREQAIRNRAQREQRVSNNTGVHPEVSGPMIGHCGLWQVVVEQMTCAICGRPLLTLNSTISIQ